MTLRCTGRALGHGAGKGGCLVKDVVSSIATVDCWGLSPQLLVCKLYRFYPLEQPMRWLPVLSLREH